MRKKTLFKIIVIPMIALILAVVSPEILQPMGITMGAAEAAPKISARKKYLIKGRTFTLKLKGNKKKVKWTRSNRNIKIIRLNNNTVRIKGLKKGKTVVTAKVGKKKYKSTIYTETPSISKALTIVKGKYKILQLKGTAQTPKWSTTNKRVASLRKVSKYRYKVIGNRAGTAYIKVKAGGRTYKTKVTVKLSDPVKKPELKITNGIIISIYKGDKHTIKVSGAAGGITYKSSSSAIAKVNSKGIVTGLKAGKAVISVSSGGKTVKCNVEVKEKPTTITEDELIFSDDNSSSGTQWYISGGSKLVFSVASKNKEVIHSKWEVSGKGVEYEIDTEKNGDLYTSRISLTARLKGTVRVSCTVGSKTYTYIINVAGDEQKQDYEYL